VTVKQGSLLDGLPARAPPEEIVETLLSRPGLRLEQIVSTGQATPAGEWLDQDSEEWVLLVAGSARLRIEGEAEDRVLRPGDYVMLPAHCRHRVAWTDRQQPTVWLAIQIFTAC
jgi:cupin 2 domain-containing protein